MPPRKKNVSGPFYQIKIELLDAPYPLWRRIVTPGNLNLDLFIHQMIAAMGWDDYHMHLLHIGEKQYQENPAEIDGMFEGYTEPLDAGDFYLYDVMQKGDKAILEYDFGDSWEHRLTVEDVFNELPEGMKVPSCLDGEGACPPEDCGGIPGLMNLVDLMEHPKKDPDEYESFVEWLGGKKFKKNEFKASRVTTRIKVFKVFL